MSWKKWKIGVVVALVMSAFGAGAGLVAGMKLQAFVAVFCANCITHFAAFLKDHPIESIQDNAKQ